MADQDTNTHNLVILVDLRFRVLTQSVGCVTMVTASPHCGSTKYKLKKN